MPDYEKQARLSRFQGSQAISSSDYFGREEGGGGGGGGAGRANSGADFDVSASELMNKLSFQVPAVCRCTMVSDSLEIHSSLAVCLETARPHTRTL